MQYPPSLVPSGSENFETTIGAIEIPVARVIFKHWDKTSIADTWGGKALIDYNGEPMFAELALMHMAQDDGWEARWIETYGMKSNTPFHFMSWTGRPLRQNPNELITDQNALNLLETIAQKNGTYYGCWDVFIWRGGRYIFIESKRSKADKIRSTQIKWMSNGIASGLSPDNFLIVQWDFIDV